MKTKTKEIIIKNIKKWHLLSIAILFTILISAQAGFSKNNIKIYFFWGTGCPHCRDEKIFLEKLKNKYPQIEIEMIEVWNDKNNKEIFKKVLGLYGIETPRVPITIIGDNEPIIGYFNEAISGRIIEKTIQRCIESGCKDRIEKYLKQNRTTDQPEPKIIPENPGLASTNSFLNKLQSKNVSFPIFTIFIALLDSFNPCVFFVLTFLMGLLIHAGTIKRMALIGTIFVTFSAAIYFTFMVAWLNLFLFIGRVKIVTTSAGLIALLIAMLNIKDFFFFKVGVSLTIPDKKKPQISKRIRKLIYTDSLFFSIIGTIILATLTNLYELLCTAGFPMVYTRILTLQKFDKIRYYLYLLLYNITYVIPLIIIVAVFCFTLGRRKMSELKGRRLKFISGCMMLSLGLIMILKPALLNNILYTILVMTGSIGVSLLLPKIIYNSRVNELKIQGGEKL